MRKIGLFALMTTLVSLGAFADTVVTSKTYVDAKVQAQGSTAGSILSASSPDDKAPSSKAVYTALQGIDGATPYSAGTGIDITNHVISTDAQVNTIESVKVNGAALTPDANKAVNVTVAEGTTNGTVKVNGTDVSVHGLNNAAYKDVAAGITSTDTGLPTAQQVYNYIDTNVGAAYTGNGLITVDPSTHVITTAAEANVIEGITVGGASQNPTNKVVALGAAAGKAVETAISSTAANNTDAEVPTAKAVYDYVNPIQTAVTALQSCTHTCTSSDPTNAPNACDLITINCVETGA
ncbi:MAG: hypothetical protein J6S80_01140 [Alphaproteobacteria bacterium]|nr:hypothetical protein [Alphaproteobacteria bacterium]